MKYFQWTSVLAMVVLVWGCSPQKIAKKGNRAFEQLAYASAIEHYEKALKKGVKDWDVYRKLGDSYRLINDPVNAVRIYEKGLKASHKPEYDLYFGQSLMEVGRYGDALECLRTYQSRGGDEQVASNLITACENVIALGKDRGRFELIPTNINSEYADFGPMLHDGQLFFSTGRDLRQSRFKWNDSRFLNLYAAKYNGSARLGEPKELGGNINSGYHESNLAFNSSGDRIFFTRNNLSSGRLRFSENKVVKLKLFEVERKGERWVEKGEFPFNNDNYSVGHPTLSTNGEVLVFASDMPGGLGGVDLYCSHWDGKSWSKPMNLGAKINTKEDEMFPWIGDEGLYFASSGHAGLGGLDIFKVAVSEDMEPKGNVENLGGPINSRYDDFQIVMDPKMKIGFFTSNRMGGEGDDDILAFVIRHPFHGIVTDELSGEPIDGVELVMEDVNGKRWNNLTDKEGRFVQGVKNSKVRFYLEREGYEPEVRTVNINKIEAGEEYAFSMKPKVPCGDGALTLKGRTLEGSALKPGTLVKIEQKEIYVESDANGEIKVPLSQGFEYVVSIAEPGISEPVVQKVDTRGLSADAEVAVDLVYDLVEDGLEPIVEVEDSVTPFYVIYYNYDRSEIRPGDARPELDRVVNYMKKKSKIKVKLSSHTDSRGADAYNLNLSRKRAMEAFEYLTSHGISHERLDYSFHGEEILSNNCPDGVKCSEEQHQKNRRTEFRILK